MTMIPDRYICLDCGKYEGWVGIKRAKNGRPDLQCRCDEMIKIDCELEADVVATLIGHIDLIVPTYKKVGHLSDTVKNLGTARDCFHAALENQGVSLPASPNDGLPIGSDAHVPVNAVGAGGLAGPSYCAKCGVSLPEGASRECSPERETQPVSTGVTEASDALSWLASNTRMALEHYSPIYGDDDDQSEEWRVIEQRGSINDREYNCVGRGETPLTALLAALKGGGDNANKG